MTLNVLIIIKLALKDRLKDIISIDGKKKKDKKQVNVTKTYYSDFEFICVTISEYSLNDWVLDSAYYFHMFTTKELFDSHNPCNDGDVIMAKIKE